MPAFLLTIFWLWLLNVLALSNVGWVTRLDQKLWRSSQIRYSQSPCALWFLVSLVGLFKSGRHPNLLIAVCFLATGFSRMLSSHSHLKSHIRHCRSVFCQLSGVSWLPRKFALQVLSQLMEMGTECRLIFKPTCASVGLLHAGQVPDYVTTLGFEYRS